MSNETTKSAVTISVAELLYCVPNTAMADVLEVLAERAGAILSDLDFYRKRVVEVEEQLYSDKHIRREDYDRLLAENDRFRAELETLRPKFNTPEYDHVRDRTLVTNLREHLSKLTSMCGLTEHEYKTAQKNKIAAIKLVRERADLGLKDAKDLVEASLAQLGTQP